MKKLLVIFHVYYHDHVAYFIDKLKNINGCKWDLIVTYSEQSQRTMNKFKAFKPDVRFMQVGNTGYDVWPFIQTIKATDLSGYDYILKLHTKNTNNPNVKLNGLRQTGSRWRNLLIDSLLKSPKQFGRCLKRFESNPKTGFLCCYELFLGLNESRPEDTFMLEEEATRIGLQIKKGKFCAGTIFMIRPECLKSIIEADFTPEMWVAGKSHSLGTLAHVYERLFCIAVLDAGYKCSTITANRKKATVVLIHKRTSNVLKYIFTINRRPEDRKKFMILFGRRIMIE